MPESKELIIPKFLPEVVDETGEKITGPQLETVTSLVTQMAQLAQLARIRRTLEKQEAQMEKVPVGRMRPYALTIEGSDIWRMEVKSPKYVGRPCNSATVLNNGPDSVFVCLNDIRDGFQEVLSGESLDFDFRSPKIERFFFKSTAGGTANLRIPLEY